MIGPPRDEDEAIADAYVEQHFAQARRAQPPEEPVRRPEDDDDAGFAEYMSRNFPQGPRR